MTTKHLQPGRLIDWTNGTAGAVASGDVVVMTGMIGIAMVDIAIGATGAVAVEGVFNDVPKVTAAVFGVGEKLLWDSSVSKFDDSAAVAASGDILGAVVAWEAGTGSQTTCTVKLTPGNSTLTA